MWFLLFSLGALALFFAGLPAARRLPAAPPPEALVACYFLLAALLRLLVRNARLAAFERKARREARRKDDKKKPTSVMGELGLGVGRGALQAVGGDVLGAGLSLASALLRGAASSLSAPPPPQRERRRAIRWEQLKAAVCIAGVGLVCAGVAWEPLLHTRLARAVEVAAREVVNPTAARSASATATVKPRVTSSSMAGGPTGAESRESATATTTTTTTSPSGTSNMAAHPERRVPSVGPSGPEPRGPESRETPTPTPPAR